MRALFQLTDIQETVNIFLFFFPSVTVTLAGLLSVIHKRKRATNKSFMTINTLTLDIQKDPAPRQRTQTAVQQLYGAFHTGKIFIIGAHAWGQEKKNTKTTHSNSLFESLFVMFIQIIFTQENRKGR